MITSLKPLLKAAEQGQFAYGAFNINAISQLEGALRIHELFNSPMIVQGAELANGFLGGAAQFKQATFEQKQRGMALLGKAFHDQLSRAKIPGVLHLDHGTSFEICKAAIDGGYTSVMIDGSSKPLEENIEVTARVVEYAHQHGVSVEGELGILAGVEDEIIAHHSTYTNPLDAVRFVRETGVDALAISYGTSHGANKGQSVRLREEIVIAVRECLKHEDLQCGIVSHGSSNVEPWLVEAVNALGGDIRDAGGIALEQLQSCIQAGVRKINVDTDIRLMTTRAIREWLRSAPSKEQWLEQIQNRLTAQPEQFDPRFYLQDSLELLQKPSKHSTTPAQQQLQQVIQDAMMSVCGRLIVAFGSYEKAPLVEPLDLTALKQAYAAQK